MDSVYAPQFFTAGVPPFGHPRIVAYLQLPAAFRSLSRPSSAPNAKASSICSSSLELPSADGFVCFPGSRFRLNCCVSYLQFSLAKLSFFYPTEKPDSEAVSPAPLSCFPVFPVMYASHAFFRIHMIDTFLLFGFQ